MSPPAVSMNFFTTATESCNENENTNICLLWVGAYKSMGLC